MRIRPARLTALSLLLVTGSWLFEPSAYTCPICDTGTGRQVRAGLFDGHFARNAAAILLPFPIFAGVVALLHFGPPMRREKGDKVRGWPGD
jgi:hypothetical protein